MRDWQFKSVFQSYSPTPITVTEVQPHMGIFPANKRSHRIDSRSTVGNSSEMSVGGSSKVLKPYGFLDTIDRWFPMGIDLSMGQKVIRCVCG